MWFQLSQKTVKTDATSVSGRICHTSPVHGFYRKAAMLLAVLLAFCACVGCAGKETVSPVAVAILAEGEEITSLSLIKGETAPVLTAQITPADYSGELLWESSDAGVVRVVPGEDNTCSLKVLKAGSVKITLTCGTVKVTVKVKVQTNQSQLTEKETAYFINDTRYSKEMLNLYFADAYSYFINSYGSFAYYYGLDTSTGYEGLEDQSCDYSTDGTWRGYFLEGACSDLLYTVALCDWADANGYALSETEEAEIATEMETLEETATDNGYGSGLEYLQAIFGSNMTLELYEQYLTDSALASVAYNAYSESLTYTEDELNAYCAEAGYEGEDYEYATTAMRHILFMAEADEDGNYTEEAIAAAREQANTVYNEWLAGGATEESFCELVTQYSADTSSVPDGGLYENIGKGQMVDAIDEWLFDSSRQTGDTALLDNNGSYVGTHIVYFCGTGDSYGLTLARDELSDSDLSTWLEELVDAYTCSEGVDYDNAGYLSNPY